MKYDTVNITSHMGDNKVAMPIITHHMRLVFSVMSIYDNTPSHL